MWFFGEMNQEGYSWCLNPVTVIVMLMCPLSYMFRMVLETDANVIAGKVAMQSTEASGSLSEQV